MSNDTHEKVLKDLHDAIGEVVGRALHCDQSETNAFVWTPEDFDVFLDRQAKITWMECAEVKNQSDEIQWISVAEAAEILGVHRNRVLQLVNAGDIDGQKIGHRWNIDKASVETRASNPPKPGRRW